MLIVAVGLFAIGWVLEIVRFAAAQLPAVDGVEAMSVGQVLSHGVLWTGEIAVVSVALGVLAWLAARRNWDRHGKTWQAIGTHGVARASETKDATPPGDWPLQVVAGFNILIIAGLIAIGAGRLASLFVTRAYQADADWLAVVVGALIFAAAWFLLTKFGPLLKPGLHVVVWVAVALAALFASAPVGVLLLTAAVVATAGRAIARWQRPQTLAGFARSKVVWVVVGICAMLGLAYSAMGPVGFPRVVVTTPSGDVLGGYVGRGGDGVDVATCTALADATSTDTRLRLVPTRNIESVLVGGGTAYLDTGARPSLGRLALHALGLGANPPTLFSATLRAPQPTCAGTGPPATTPGVADPQLGPGVVAGPAPPHGQALDGEAPVGADRYLTPTMAALAQRYQPTVLVTAADRNWPVSVGSVLAERGSDGEPVCLHPPLGAAGTPLCHPTAAQLESQPGGYLQLPATLGRHPGPDAQFRSFLAGLGQSLPARREWLADPSSLDPWKSAQLYFYYAPGIPRTAWPKKAVIPGGVTSGLVGLEYWFFYPFNYYPTVIDDGLMNQAPIAGDRANVDLHQGDWEHVDVLLDPTTMRPEWLYLARHDFEGAFVPWNSPTMRFDEGHPVVQAAFGGHPSYLPDCGPGPRAVARDLTADWLSCGSGRFAFRAATTPLVDVQAQPWACWPGYFGENGARQASPTAKTDYLASLHHTVFATPPRGPLVQAENVGVCQSDRPTGTP
ncbi:MAG: hypothetical protein ACRDPM_26845 [Solirubrobacteraceae bacterium]